MLNLSISSAMLVDPSQAVKTENEIGQSHAEFAIYNSKRLEDDLRALGSSVERHENNIRFLNAQRLKLEESIIDLEAKLEGEEHLTVERDDQITGQILQHCNTAAGIYCQIKTNYATQASLLPFAKDILGAVAELGKVEDENLSRILSEYLGLETMLAFVCKNYEVVKRLEKYVIDGSIDKNFGLHGLASSVGRTLNGRFSVICLDSTRPYTGRFLADDSQRRLDILKPRLSNGECPSGFIGFAVNMIKIDVENLFCVSGNGFGLRETLFYPLLGRTQVYTTRADMVNAIPSITEGAVSLDGGMIRGKGIYSLGSREEFNVIFPKPLATQNQPDNYLERVKRIKELKSKKDNCETDLKREEVLRGHAISDFNKKKQEFMLFVAQSSAYTTQLQMRTAAQERHSQQ